MKNYHLLAIVMLLLLVACGESTPDVAKNPVPVQKEFPEFFQKVLDAHGGWETWNEMNTLKFTATQRQPNTHYTVDLKSRKEVIEMDGKYKFGNDGEKVWITPARDSFPSKSPRFVKNLLFYFVAVPFVFADDGVNLEDQGMTKVDGRDYQMIKATFGEGIGDAPEDQYIMYVNPNTSRVHILTYSVTYFDKSRATNYNALMYSWENVNGLLFPSKNTGYKWVDGTLGDKRYEAPFANASYSKEKMEETMFDIPEGAWTE